MRTAISIFLIAGLFFSACKKSQTPSSNVTLPSGYYFIKTQAVISFDSLGNRTDSSVTTYTYDAQGRSTNLLASQYDVTVNPQGQLLYSYNTTYSFSGAGKVIVNQPGSQSSTYYINATTNLSDSSVTTTNGTTTILVTRFYYDANGYRTKSDNYTLNSGIYSQSSEDDYTITNGNIIQDITYNDNDIYAGINDTLSSVFPNIPFPLPNEPVIGEYLASYGITGKTSVNLLSAISSDYLGAITNLNYSYTFDGENRVSQLIETVAGTNQVYALVHYYFDE
jgi:hypothetical protein